MRARRYRNSTNPDIAHADAEALQNGRPNRRSNRAPLLDLEISLRSTIQYAESQKQHGPVKVIMKDGVLQQ